MVFRLGKRGRSGAQPMHLESPPSPIDRDDAHLVLRIGVRKNARKYLLQNNLHRYGQNLIRGYDTTALGTSWGQLPIQTKHEDQSATYGERFNGQVNRHRKTQ